LDGCGGEGWEGELGKGGMVNRSGERRRDRLGEADVAKRMEDFSRRRAPFQCRFSRALPPLNGAWAGSGKAQIKAHVSYQVHKTTRP
jgi:hypothetical protein